jgi:SAM-dependent methyltransferase
MMRTPSYQNIISRLKSGSSILDLGCCVAQDLRKLVHDGAPSTNIYGADLHGKFISLGYDLFLDKKTFGVKFMEADVFDLDSPLKDLEGKMDIIHIGLFLHIFDLEGQIKACERIVRLARPVNGTLIVGQQTGKPVAGNQPTRRGMTFKHNVETFESMWRVVGEKTGTHWEVRARLDEGLGVADKNRTWDDPSIRRLAFEVERIG